jgi:hypothetical protein
MSTEPNSNPNDTLANILARVIQQRQGNAAANAQAPQGEPPAFPQLIVQQYHQPAGLTQASLLLAAILRQAEVSGNTYTSSSSINPSQLLQAGPQHQALINGFSQPQVAAPSFATGQQQTQQSIVAQMPTDNNVKLAQALTSVQSLASANPELASTAMRHVLSLISQQDQQPQVNPEAGLLQLHLHIQHNQVTNNVLWAMV